MGRCLAMAGGPPQPQRPARQGRSIARQGVEVPHSHPKAQRGSVRLVQNEKENGFLDTSRQRGHPFSGDRVYC